MSNRILVPVDGSDKSAEALTFAADEWPDAELTLLHVINPAEAASTPEGTFPGAVEQWYEAARERGEAVVSNAADSVDRAVETRVEVGRPAHTIVEVADEIDAHSIVIGSHGRSGVSRVLLGSVAESVMRNADRPVTVVR